MAVQKVDKRDWRAFFDWLSQNLLGARAEIEVASLDLGDQIETEWLPLVHDRAPEALILASRPLER